jgi:type IV pilus assembly protein PilE
VRLTKGLRMRGFTLVELMVTVVILAILAAIALPSYRQYVMKGRRSDAFAAMAVVQQAQERARANLPTYSNDLAALGLPAAFAGQHYDIAIQGVSASGYTITASPKASGLQAADADCTSLSIVMSRGTATYRATGSGARDTSALCWPK